MKTLCDRAIRWIIGGMGVMVALYGLLIIISSLCKPATAAGGMMLTLVSWGAGLAAGSCVLLILYAVLGGGVFTRGRQGILLRLLDGAVYAGFGFWCLGVACDPSGTSMRSSIYWCGIALALSALVVLSLFGSSDEAKYPGRGDSPSRNHASTR